MAECKKNSVRLQTAFHRDENGVDTVVFPQQAKVMSGGTDHCPACGHKVISVCPLDKQDHFRHQYDIGQEPCNGKGLTYGETPVHEIGKQFVEKYLPLITFRKMCVCCKLEHTTVFSNHSVKLEKQAKCENAKYIPDVKIYDSENNFVGIVEVVFSNKSGRTKLKRFEDALGFDNVFEVRAQDLYKEWIRMHEEKKLNITLPVAFTFDHAPPTVCADCDRDCVCCACKKTYKKYHMTMMDEKNMKGNDCVSRDAEIKNRCVNVIPPAKKQKREEEEIEWEHIPLKWPFHLNEATKAYFPSSEDLHYNQELGWHAKNIRVALKLRNYIVHDRHREIVACAPDKLWLSTPYAEKDVAKDAGATFLGGCKSWYAPTQDVYDALPQYYFDNSAVQL